MWLIFWFYNVLFFVKMKFTNSKLASEIIISPYDFLCNLGILLIIEIEPTGKSPRTKFYKGLKKQALE